MNFLIFAFLELHYFFATCYKFVCMCVYRMCECVCVWLFDRSQILGKMDRKIKFLF